MPRRHRRFRCFLKLVAFKSTNLQSPDQNTPHTPPVFVEAQRAGSFIQTTGALIMIMIDNEVQDQEQAGTVAISNTLCIRSLFLCFGHRSME